MALASVAPPSTVVRTPVKRLLESRVLLVCRQNFQTLHQRQAGVDHDRELAEENRDVLGLDLAGAERRHDKFLALFPDGARRDAFAPQLAGQRLLVGSNPLAGDFSARTRSFLKM